MVLVVGSINYDYILKQGRLPRRGETLSAAEVHGSFGGKGANQAVQAARLGSPVQLIGAVGSDLHGELCRKNLHDEGVETHLRPSSIQNGLGIVHVVGRGEVYSTIFEGANKEVDASWVAKAGSIVGDAAIVIIQNEIPAEANEKVIDLAVQAGVRVVYNGAPARPINPSVLRKCAWFVVNEDEASTYLGRDLGDLEDAERMRAAVKDLQGLCPNVVLTLGSLGCHVASGATVQHVPAIETSALDTTGAGDSFIGAFAHALVSDKSPLEATLDATRVASLTVRGFGAQTSMPTQKELDREVVRETGTHT